MLKISPIIFIVLILNGCAFVPSSYEVTAIGKSFEEKDYSTKTINKKYADGSWYKGAAIGGLPEGQGMLMLANGDIYKGAFVKGRMDGKGVLSSKRGSIFTGHFTNDRFVSGKVQDKKGMIVTGRFNQDRSVDGKMTFKGKVVYEGQMAYSDAKGYYRHGKGEYKSKKGIKYSGYFKNGKKDGEFVTTYKKAQYFQVWKQDQLVWQTFSMSHLKNLSGSCKLKTGYIDWVVTKGKCKNGLLEGTGEVTRSDSRAIAFGYFSAGELKGGELNVLNGVSYRGGFHALKPHGDNVAEFNNNKLTYSGGFRNGIRHGAGVCSDNGSKTYCEFDNGRRVDAVYLAKNQLKSLRAIASNYKQSVDKKLEAEIEQKRKEIEREHQARVNQLENQMNNVTMVNMAKAFSDGVSYGAHTSAGDAAIRAQVEKTNQFKAKIEREKQSHRRQMQRKESEWVRWKKSQMAQKQGDFNKYFKQWQASARSECLSINDRAWENNICMHKDGLLDSEIYALNDIINEQMEIKHGANRAYQLSGKLDSFARKSSKLWNEKIRSAAKAENDRQSHAAIVSGIYDSVNTQVYQAKSEFNRINEMYKPKPKYVAVGDSGTDEVNKSLKKKKRKSGKSRKKTKESPYVTNFTQYAAYMRCTTYSGRKSIEYFSNAYPIPMIPKDKDIESEYNRRYAKNNSAAKSRFSESDIRCSENAQPPDAFGGGWDAAAAQRVRSADISAARQSPNTIVKEFNFSNQY